MPWTKNQKSLAVQACRARKIDRHLLLRQFEHAFYREDEETGKVVRVDEPTSTSPKLTQADFEKFMAVVEGGEQILHFSPGYWQSKVDDPGQRMRDRATRLYNSLALHGLLEGDGVGLAGWIEKRVTGGRTNQLGDLNPHELRNLIEGLQALADRNGLEAWASAEEAAPF